MKTKQNMSRKRYNRTDYLRMPMSKNNNSLVNLGNRILVVSDPLLRPIVKRIRKTAKYIRYKSGKFNKSRKNR